ncbi:hypothetical protein EVA_10857 [gut metagenome]|uniref:Uncharacterized protein n=1 Tax=gut metagenome TaxID=749906 RepID=J9CLT2_9ZZZZ
MEKRWIAMQEVKTVLGHEEILKHLQNAAAMNQVSHSYIFVRREGKRKKTSGKTFCYDIAM